MSLPTKQKIRMFIGALVCVIFGGLLASLMFMPVPPQNADIVKVLVGFVGGAFVMMVSFYFGDSEGKE
jgi:hypothetical protein